MSLRASASRAITLYLSTSFSSCASSSRNLTVSASSFSSSSWALCFETTYLSCRFSSTKRSITCASTFCCCLVWELLSSSMISVLKKLPARVMIRLAIPMELVCAGYGSRCDCSLCGVDRVWAVLGGNCCFYSRLGSVAGTELFVSDFPGVSEFLFGTCLVAAWSSQAMGSSLDWNIASTFCACYPLAKESPGVFSIRLEMSDPSILNVDY